MEEPNCWFENEEVCQAGGEKRDQLLTDFDIYANPEIAISMTNEEGEATEYDHDQFNERTTRGIVLVDAPGIVGRLHYDTVRLTAEAPHPIAVMTRSDFETHFPKPILSQISACTLAIATGF